VIASFLVTSNIARAMHVSRHPKNCLPSQHAFIKTKERLVLLNISDRGAGSKEFEAPANRPCKLLERN
jgi:hypothetical protein